MSALRNTLLLPNRLRLSVVVPVYNEYANIPLVSDQLRQALGSIEAEVIVVDDGSDDGSAELLQEDCFFRYIGIPRSGKTAALKAGMQVARAPIIATVDADLQEDPSHIIEGLQKVDQGADMVIGVRIRRKDPLLKKKLPGSDPPADSDAGTR